MFKNHLSTKKLLLLALTSSLLAFPSCSPKIKLGIWAKQHQEAAIALGTWAADNPVESTLLLNMDCMSNKAFKKKIADALNRSGEQQPNNQQNGYDVSQHNYHYANAHAQASRDGFGDWCRKYPQAAKTLRGHAKALCKTGLGILSGKYKIN